MGLFNKTKNNNVKILGGNEQRTYIPSMSHIGENIDGQNRSFVASSEPVKQTISSNKFVSLKIKSGFLQPYLKNYLVIEPKNFDDVKVVLDYIKSGSIVPISLDNLTDEVAQRILDFVSGASYAIGASVQRYEKSTFIISPKGCEVTPYRNEK